MSSARVVGSVSLVGAGPGDPGLITVRALECLRRAEVVVYDRLANPQLLREARPEAERIFVGKSSEHHALSQAEINDLLVRLGRAGRLVVRLKGGDPFVFGRGGEEAEALAAAGIPFEIVPGVTSAIAAAAYAGIPVTHRGLAASFAVITGHEDPTKPESDLDWAGIARGANTLVFLMGIEQLPQIAAQLVRHGRPPETPAAVVRWGTHPEQETLVGTLGDIAARVRAAGLRPPAVTIVGEVVGLRARLRWFDNRPLFGRRVLVTRSREQASELSEHLRALGAVPIECPVLALGLPEDTGPLDGALDGLGAYDWIVFTSANGVGAVVERLRARGRDVRAFGPARLAAIGPATARELERCGLRVDYVPDVFVAEAVAAGLPDVAGKRILLPRADLAREALAIELRKRGALVDEVVAYCTRLAAPEGVDVAAMLRGGELDAVTFTSSSTVRNLLALLDGPAPAGLLRRTVVACIGPITADTARGAGLEPAVIAEEHTIPGLVQALVRYFESSATEAVE